MKRFPYLLILILLSAPVDEVWAVAPVLPFAPLAEDNADDNDEYLPTQRPPQGEQSASRDKPVCDGLKPQHADFSFVPRGLPSEWNLTTPFAPPSCYVFMSLQI